MSPTLNSRILSTFALVIAAFTLSAWDAFRARPPPTHQFVLQAELSNAVSPDGQASAVESTMAVLEGRLEQMGTPVHSIAHQGEGRIVLATSGEDSPQTVRTAIGRRGELSFLKVDDRALPENTYSGIANPGSKILPLADGMGPIAVKRLGGISGDRVEQAQMGYNRYTNEPVVNLLFDERGGELFARLSTQHVGQQFAIVIDDTVVSAPFFSEPILGGQAEISGGFTAKEAQELAVALGSGALPVDVELVFERTIPAGE
ncbi:MAG: hypothetical protein AAF697_08045 [Pseudomonadota bacterium]